MSYSGPETAVASFFTAKITRKVSNFMSSGNEPLQTYIYI